MVSRGVLRACLLLLVACQMALIAHSAPLGDGQSDQDQGDPSTTTTEAPSGSESGRKSGTESESRSGEPLSVESLEANDGYPVPPSVQSVLDEIVDEIDDELFGQADTGRTKRSAEYGYGDYGNGYDDGYGYGGGSGGYGGGSGGYGGGSGYGYGYGYNTGHHYGYPKTYYGKPSMVSFVKSFRPGKTYVEKGHVIRNYYIHGSYNVALQHYKYIPSLTVVPYTSYYKVPYGRKVQTTTGYKAYICKSCYHGYPKIDVYEDKKPYNYVVRRFIYLPQKYNLSGYGHNSYDGYGGGSYGYSDGGHGGYGGNDYGYAYGSNSYGGYDR